MSANKHDDIVKPSNQSITPSNGMITIKGVRNPKQKSMQLEAINPQFFDDDLQKILELIAQHNRYCKPVLGWEIFEKLIRKKMAREEKAKAFHACSTNKNAVYLCQLYAATYHNLFVIENYHKSLYMITLTESSLFYQITIWVIVLTVVIVAMLAAMHATQLLLLGSLLGGSTIMLLCIETASAYLKKSHRVNTYHEIKNSFIENQNNETEASQESQKNPEGIEIEVSQKNKPEMTDKWLQTFFMKELKIYKQSLKEVNEILVKQGKINEVTFSI